MIITCCLFGHLIITSHSSPVLCMKWLLREARDGDQFDSYLVVQKNIIKLEMTKSSQVEFLAKIIIIGDSGVGKTILLTKFCDGVFKDSYVATIGVDFKLKTVNVDTAKVKLQVWDTAGQQRFKNITQTYYKGAAGIILAYSINNKQSFKNITGWIKQIEGNTKENVCKILVGLKCDLTAEREVEQEEGRALAEKHKMLFLEVSAKSGRNVEEAFLNLTKQIRNSRAAIPSDDDTINLQAKTSKPDKKENCAC